MRKVLTNKVFPFIITLLLLANISMLVYFLGIREPIKKHHHTEKPKSPISIFLEKQVGFDQEQMAEYEKMRQRHRQQIKPLFEEIRMAKVEFFKLLSNDGINDSALNIGASKIGEKQKNLDLQAFKNFRELRTLCKAEQEPVYDSLITHVIVRMWFSPRKESMRKNKDSVKSSR